MGLFDWIRNRKEGDEPGDLNQYAGMRLEVMDEDERLLFAARADIAWDGGMELRPITTPRLPPNASSVPVQMRGYQMSVKKAVHMSGNVSVHKDGTWSVDDLRVTGKDNDRSFYRQETLIGGTIMPLRQKGVYELPCRLINISAGGVCIQSGAEFMIGERLLLKSSLLEGWSVTPLMCEVRRVARRMKLYECGCEFADLTPAVEDHIARAILEMQRQRRNPGVV